MRLLVPEFVVRLLRTILKRVSEVTILIFTSERALRKRILILTPYSLLPN